MRAQEQDYREDAVPSGTNELLLSCLHQIGFPSKRILHKALLYPKTCHVWRCPLIDITCHSFIMLRSIKQIVVLL